MPTLDDLLRETEDKDKKKGGLDALLRETEQPKAKGLDALLAETGEPIQPRPTLTPTPFTGTRAPQQFITQPPTPSDSNPPFPEPDDVFERIQNQAAESVRADMGTEPRYPSNLPPGAPPPSMSLQDMEMFRRAGAEAKRQVETGEIPKSQAIAAGVKPFTSVPRMYLMALTPASVVTGGGWAATGLSAATGGGINIGAEVADRLMAEGRMPTKGETAIAGTVGAVLGPLAKPVSRAPLGKVIKKISGFFDTSPSQVNKVLGEVAKETGATRGDVANNIILNASQEPEGARYFAEYLDEAGKGGDSQVFSKAADEAVPESSMVDDALPQSAPRLTPDEEILPTDFNAEAITRELDPFQTPRVAPVKTLKNVNLSRMDDEQLSRFIDSTVQQSPEFRIPNEVVAHDVLKERARRFGTGTIEKYLEDVNALAPGTPEADIRRIASEVLAAEDVLKAHMEGETMNLARLVAEGKGDRGALRDALVADLRLLRKTGGVSSEFGRALGSRRIKATGEMGMEQRFLREVNKVIGKDANLDQIATRVSQIDIFDPTARQLFLRDLVHATTREKIDEIFYNSILSGIITQGRNIAGNVGVIITREAERPFATAADAVSSLVTGRQRQRYFSESAKAAFGLIEGTREGLNAGWKSFMTEVPQFGLEAGIMSDLPAQRIGGAIRGTKGRIFRLPSRALMATDDFFKAVAYRMELNARAYREARNVARANNWTSEQMLDLYNHLRYHPTDPLIRGARDEALIRTFQTPAGEIGQAMVQARDKVPGLRYFMPFVRTPLNIMEFGVERIPGVNLLSILNRSRQGLPIDWTEEFAKTAIGTMIAGGVYLAHQRGAINGFGPNERTGEEKAFLTSGRQRYSINIGDTSISFQNFEPFSTMLGFMADTFDAIDSGIPIISEDMALNIGKSLGRNLTEKSFGMGLDTALNFMTGDFERGKAGLVRTASSFVPFSSLTRSAAISMDPTVRRVQSLGDAFKGNIPGLRGDLEPVLDIWGNEVVTEAGVLQRMAEAAGIHADIPGQMLRIRELSEDPATKEVFRLSQRFPDEPFTGLGTPKREIKGIELTREEYVAYVKAAGQLAHQGVTQFMNSNVYPRLPDEIKKKQIEKIILKAREQARNRFLYEKRKSGALKQ